MSMVTDVTKGQGTMLPPTEPVKYSHCVLTPTLSKSFSILQPFAKTPKQYMVTANGIGKEWIIGKKRLGDTDLWLIDGKGQSYRSPDEAAKAINRLLQG
jgi:hypothetical protein